MSWNRPENTTSHPVPVRGRGWLKGFAAALIIVLGSSAVFVLFRRTEPRESAPAPSAAKKVLAEVTPKSTAQKTARPAETPVSDPRFPYTDGRKVVSSHTNNWDQVIDICIMPNGKSRKVIRNLRPPVFANASDQIIAMAVSGDMDEELPPVPLSDDMEADFLDSLKTPIVIGESDSDAVKEAKMRVMEAREIIREEMKKGRGFREILADHLEQRRENAKTREMALTAASELKKEGDPELLNEYLRKVNGLMREKGLREIEAPRLRHERQQKGDK